jgi:hypothetical protein
MLSYEEGQGRSDRGRSRPILTKKDWVYSLACFQEADRLLDSRVSCPRSLRVAYITRLLASPNMRRLLFWSEAEGRRGVVRPRLDRSVLAKSDVVYPAVRRVVDEDVDYRDRAVTVLFSGDFFRKGGVNVVDAFEQARSTFRLPAHVVL